MNQNSNTINSTKFAVKIMIFATVGTHIRQESTILIINNIIKTGDH